MDFCMLIRKKLNVCLHCSSPHMHTDLKEKKKDLISCLHGLFIGKSSFQQGSTGTEGNHGDQQPCYSARAEA